MKKRITFVVVLSLLLAGCACMSHDYDGNRSPFCQFFVSIADFFLGDTKSVGFTLLGMGLNTLIPGGSAILATAAAGYQTMRKSQWQRAFETTAQVIENGAELGMSAQDIKPHLEMAHVVAGVDHLTGPAVEKIQPDPIPAPTV